MLVKKYHYSALNERYEWYREIPDVDSDSVLAKMSTDMPYEADNKPTWLYEAGEFVNGKFVPEMVWYSENGSLFD